MEGTKKMSLMKRIAILPAAVAVCGIAAGCFSYHKTVDETSPAPVVETAPAPVVAVPSAETSSTTTTTTDNGLVQRQRTTTYTAP
jgi:hypothetical protein